MWDFDHDILPVSLSSYFSRRNETHTYLTRLATSNKLTINQFNTNKYGRQSFQIQGALLLNELKEQELYTNAKTKQGFLKKFKENIIASY